MEVVEVAEASTPVSDTEFFASENTRRFRVRAWQRSDRPDLIHPRDTPLRVPVCSVVEMRGNGPVVVVQPTSLGSASLADTDANARALITAAGLIA